MHPVTKKIRGHGQHRFLLSTAQQRVLLNAASGDTRLYYNAAKRRFEDILGRAAQCTTVFALERKGYLWPIGLPGLKDQPRDRQLSAVAHAYLRLLDEEPGLKEKPELMTDSKIHTAMLALLSETEA